MNGVIVASLMLLAPATVTAQARPAHPEGGLFEVIAVAAPTVADTVPRAAPQAQPQDTVAIAQRPRRRGSMVGYIDDPTIATRIRLRFEAGFHSHVPDRAEFFYAKCGCYRDLPPENPAYDPLAPGPGPGVPSHVDFQQLYLSGEYAVSERLSAFVQVPMRWIQPEFESTAAGFSEAAGLGDLRVGVKLGLTARTNWIATLQVQAYLPTGDPAKGLGTDHSSIEPAVLYHHRVADRLLLEAQGGIWLPLGGSAGVPTTSDERFAGSILYAGIGQSYELYRSERLQFAPVIELLGWRVLGGSQTGASPDASGTNIGNLKIGARTSFGRGSIYLGYGTALTRESWYEEIIRAEYRHTF